VLVPVDEFTMRDDLIRLLCDKSFKFSDTPSFRLVSGRMSRYYVNCKPTTLHPLGMYLAGHLVFEAVADLKLDAVGGMTFGADPIAVAAAFASQLRQQPVKAFSIRKTRKDHGIIRWIEGDLKPGDRVAVIEDVVTTGGSTLKAIERAREEGLRVERVVVLVDRQEGGLEAIGREVPDTVAIVTRDELLAHLGHKPWADD
jgi:orotate phosphoribosyltransferase